MEYNIKADAWDILGQCFVETVTALDGINQMKETRK
jgi:hypothetical protein